ncbi:MAG: glycine dehydrogenase, partial [Negativicutes bacterium]|nr:glycine dehydrogenase [Negativicutes bacterium]
MVRSYLPHTEADRAAMLAAIGVKSTGELFADIPVSLRLARQLDLPAAMSEPELVKHLKELAGKNSSAEENACFLGAGAYDHYIPSV